MLEKYLEIKFFDFNGSRSSPYLPNIFILLGMSNCVKKSEHEVVGRAGGREREAAGMVEVSTHLRL